MAKQPQNVPAVIGQHTQPDIEKWKAKHGDVRSFTQKDEEGNTHVTYFRPPNFDDIDYAREVGDGDGTKIGVAMANNVRLGGSDQVMENFRLKHGFMKAVLKLATAIEGDVEKL
ncbi:MAG: hypothetical protein JJE55_06860 [Flavobacteriaceae bacterium]|nr:hypothetical protein [Flavobacteriaceae bacterium]